MTTTTEPRVSGHCPVTGMIGRLRDCVQEGVCVYGERCRVVPISEAARQQATEELHTIAKRYAVQRLDLLLNGDVAVTRDSVLQAIHTACLMTYQVAGPGKRWVPVCETVVAAAREWAGGIRCCPCPQCVRKDAIAGEVSKL